MITKQEYDNGITCKKKNCLFCKETTDCFQFKVKRMVLQGCKYTRPSSNPPPPAKNSISWCQDDLNLTCKDWGQKCFECANYHKNKEVSHFKPMK